MAVSRVPRMNDVVQSEALFERQNAAGPISLLGNLTRVVAKVSNYLDATLSNPQ